MQIYEGIYLLCKKKITGNYKYLFFWAVKMETTLERLHFVTLLFGSKAKLSKALGVHAGSMYDYYNAKTEIGASFAKRFETVGINRAWLLLGEGEVFTKSFEGENLRKVAEEKGLYLNNQIKGSVMSKPNKSGARFIATIDPQDDIKIPLMTSPVRAGEMSWAGDDVESYVSVRKYHHEGSFYVVVSGDSMIGAGIEEGMRALVDTTLSPATGDIVLAQYIDTQKYTIKRLKKNGKELLLHPDNPDYEPIVIDENIAIRGVVTKAERVFR
jgi:DNA polymerase V